MGSKLLRDKFQQLKSSQHEWKVMEKYISGQKGYYCAKTDTLPVVVIDEEKEKTLKTGIYIIPNFHFIQLIIRRHI